MASRRREIYEFHVDVPQGVSTLDVAIDFISPPETGRFSSGGSTTSQLAVLSWNQFLLYPKGTPTDQLQYQANLKIPDGWRYGTALPIERESGSEIMFKPSSLTTLIDSPGADRDQLQDGGPEPRRPRRALSAHRRRQRAGDADHG